VGDLFNYLGAGFGSYGDRCTHVPTYRVIGLLPISSSHLATIRSIDGRWRTSQQALPSDEDVTQLLRIDEQ
jgi:hypothetical protein